MISKSFNSPFNPVDTARHGCVELWAGEPWPGADNFAAGAGPGLFARPGHGGEVPAPVAGSEDYRIYALATFVTDGGTEQLVGIGILTADIRAWAAAHFVDYLTALHLFTPTALFVFVSTDGGATFTHHALGNIEQGAGPYAPVNGAPEREYYDSIVSAWICSHIRWRQGINADGARCLFCHTATHRVEFDGTAATAYKIETGSRPQTNSLITGGSDGTLAVGTINSAARHPAGTDYLIINGTALLGMNVEGALVGKGQSIVYAAEGDQATHLTLSRIRPRNRHAPQAVFEGIGDTEILHDDFHVVDAAGAAQLRAFDAVNGVWLAFFINPDDGRFYFLPFPELPDVPVTDDAAGAGTAGEATLEIDLSSDGALLSDWGVTHINSAPQRRLVIRGDVRGTGGKAYVFPRSAMVGADAARASMEVYECPANPRVGDFSNRVMHEAGGITYVGTGEGYVYVWDAQAGTVNVIGRPDTAPITALASYGVALFALTAGGLFWAPDGLAFVPLRTAPEGMSARALAVFGDMLFLAESDGLNSNVAKFDLSVDGVPVAVVDEWVDFDARAAVVFDGEVWILGVGGDVLFYDTAGNGVADTFVELAGETPSALLADGATLWLGTAEGELWRYDGADWTVEVEVGQGIAALGKQGGYLLIAIGAQQPGRFYSYHVATATLGAHNLPTCDRTDSGPDLDCSNASYGFNTTSAVPLILTSCSITPIVLPPGGGGSDPPGPGDGEPNTDTEPDAPDGIWVSAAFTAATPGALIDSVLLAPISADPGQFDFTGYLTFVRGDSEDLAPLFLPSYQAISINALTKLQRAAREIRFLVIPPDEVALAFAPAFFEQTE